MPQDSGFDISKRKNLSDLGLGFLTISPDIDIQEIDDKLLIGQLVLGPRTLVLLKNLPVANLFKELSGKVPIKTHIERTYANDPDDYTLRIVQNFGNLDDKGEIHRVIILSNQIELQVPGFVKNVYQYEVPVGSFPLKPHSWQDDGVKFYIPFDPIHLALNESKGAKISLSLDPGASSQFASLIHENHRKAQENSRLDALNAQYESLIVAEKSLAEKVYENTVTKDDIVNFLKQELTFEIAFFNFNKPSSRLSQPSKRELMINDLNNSNISSEIVEYIEDLIERKKKLIIIGRKNSTLNISPDQEFFAETGQNSVFGNISEIIKYIGLKKSAQSVYLPYVIQGLEKYLLEEIPSKFANNLTYQPEATINVIKKFLSYPLDEMCLNAPWHQVYRSVQTILPGIEEIIDRELIDKMQKIFVQARGVPFAVLRVFGTPNFPQVLVVEGCYLDRTPNKFIDSSFITYIVADPDYLMPRIKK